MSKIIERIDEQLSEAKWTTTNVDDFFKDFGTIIFQFQDGSEAVLNRNGLSPTSLKGLQGKDKPSKIKKIQTWG